MSGSASFEDVLDRTLTGGRIVPPPPFRAAARVSTAASFGFFQFNESAARPAAAVEANQVCGGPFRRAAEPHVIRRATPGPAESTTRPRCAPSRLSPEGRAALDDLRALGARIDDGFTREELRSAFRALARRFHPDHHPHAGDSARAHLSTLFRRLRSAYATLSRA